LNISASLGLDMGIVEQGGGKRKEERGKRVVVIRIGAEH
jgi:hypothetical protein